MTTVPEIRILKVVLETETEKGWKRYVAYMRYIEARREKEGIKRDAFVPFRRFLNPGLIWRLYLPGFTPKIHEWAWYSARGARRTVAPVGVSTPNWRRPAVENANKKNWWIREVCLSIICQLRLKECEPRSFKHIGRKNGDRCSMFEGIETITLYGLRGCF